MRRNGLPEMYELDKGLAEFLQRQGEFGQRVLGGIELPGPDTSDTPITPQRLQVRVFQIAEALRNVQTPRFTREPESLRSHEVNLALQGMLDGLSEETRERALEVLTQEVDMKELEGNAVYATTELPERHWPEFRFGPENGHTAQREEMAVRAAMVRNMMWDRVRGNVFRDLAKRGEFK